MSFVDLFTSDQREILSRLRGAGSASRADLAEALGLRPNTVGEAVADLLDRRVVRENEAERGSTGAGRPKRPLELDAGGRHVLGVAVRGRREGLESDEVLVRAVNLWGRSVGDGWRGPAGAQAGAAVAAMVGEATLGVSLAVPGLVDVAASGSACRANAVWGPVLDAARDLPVVVDNDGHALAARWWLTRAMTAGDTAGTDTQRSEEVLLIRLGDGRLGASVLIDGRPNRGCVIGGNELGHTRFPVETPVCFCGQSGCLERIVSTAFLHQRGASTARTLPELCSAFGSGNENDDRAVTEMTGLLAMGVSNAVQLLRPHRVVLVSELSRCEAFFSAWLGATRELLLPELRERVAFEAWDEPLASPAESAAHLGLAAVFDAGWCRA